jgi:3-oxoacyl-[acyl-carrier protein] reductase
VALLSGRTILVTGAASGIGEATARVLAEQGASVVVLGLDEPALEAAAIAVPGSYALVVDVASPSSVDAAFALATARSGHIDGVVHAAGIDDPTTKRRVAEQMAAGQYVDTVADLTDEQWRRMMAVNLDGSFHVLRAALRIMRDQGAGSVVLIGSETGVRGLAGLAHYAASKGGVHALVRSAAKEAASYGVRVNGIAPGVIDTPMSRRSAGVFGGAETAIAPIGRVGLAAEIGGVAAFLCSDLSSYVVGEIINVDGGRMAC